ncbi:MAG: hypothetical protein JWQ09_5822 [Segetibacter sp.]|nr:hypothetical protein [Segetibacter sp.]
MITTITINKEIKEAALKKAKENSVRGGLSGLIEMLLKSYIQDKQKP